MQTPVERAVRWLHGLQSSQPAPYPSAAPQRATGREVLLQQKLCVCLKNICVCIYMCVKEMCAIGCLCTRELCSTSEVAAVLQVCRGNQELSVSISAVGAADRRRFDTAAGRQPSHHHPALRVHWPTSLSPHEFTEEKHCFFLSLDDLHRSPLLKRCCGIVNHTGSEFTV